MVRGKFGLVKARIKVIIYGLGKFDVDKVLV